MSTDPKDYPLAEVDDELSELFMLYAAALTLPVTADEKKLDEAFRIAGERAATRTHRAGRCRAIIRHPAFSRRLRARKFEKCPVLLGLRVLKIR
jgi:hypothetical protein